VPTPCIFAALDAPVEARVSVPRKNEVVVRAVRGILESIVEPGRAAAGFRSIDACLRALPDGGRLLHVGVMLTRAQRPIRVSVSVPWSRATSYLQGLWRAHGPFVAGLVAEARHLAGCAQGGANAQLDFDVDPPGDHSLGIALIPSDRHAMNETLDRLVAKGLCTPRSASGVRCWIERTPEGDPLDGLERYVSHFKIAARPSEVPQTKAYLGVRPLAM
jgi:hypothetical protein